MMPSGPDTWFIPESLRTETLLAALATEFGVDAAPEYAATVTYADSFDWRLYRRGYILHCHGTAWTLYHGDSGAVTVQQGGPHLHRACFAGDFPPGSLRKVIEPLLSVRCLLPLATVSLVGRQFRLLNEDEKTVARVVFEEQRPVTGKTVYRMLRLFGVRGYDQETVRVRLLLENNGLTTPASPLIGFEEGCRAIDRRPLDYTSKFSLQLDDSLTSRQAMVLIYRHLLTAMQRNLPGVLEDLDSEFLHDFRVAIRRTRSGLSLVKKVLPASVVASFAKDFAQLGRITGPTRDLDVYLLRRDSYPDRLPAALRPGLEAFFDDLVEQRRKEVKKMAQVLRSKKTRTLLNKWRRYLASEDAKPAAEAKTPVDQLAGKIIFRRFKRVMQDGLALNADTPDADVHRLRIQCKKLRYAIEFFRTLYPEKEIQVVVRQLKKLQDILGVFNDLSVQQDMVVSTLEKRRGNTHRDLEIAAALGGLMQSLYEEQLALRCHFLEIFTRFSDPENTALFTRLFQSRK
ncbi:CHAD domain-containing protein [Desulfobulbus alkaliphilus]|uniref:CHAD domain-containing protein n=1 Tax=Desulfobulbus alkaliphilus TaxID=869814 RepID=UPI001964EA5C|nr:CHAD domain-containing protein [Desulfobulbus alkaliphilus]MBM9535486.1 CHAD domain-containing protein [Desulfobulbus alkaliphilus]